MIRKNYTRKWKEKYFKTYDSCYRRLRRTSFTLCIHHTYHYYHVHRSRKGDVLFTYFLPKSSMIYINITVYVVCLFLVVLRCIAFYIGWIDKLLFQLPTTYAIVKYYYSACISLEWYFELRMRVHIFLFIFT